MFPLCSGPDGEAGQSSVWRRLREPEESLSQAAAVSGDGEAKPSSLAVSGSSSVVFYITPGVSLQLELDLVWGGTNPRALGLSLETPPEQSSVLQTCECSSEVFELLMLTASPLIANRRNPVSGYTRVCVCL